MDRNAAVNAVVRALRQVNIQGSAFGQTVAIRLGLSESDVEALELLIDNGAATAGRLAERMGLSTGAVTRLIDRLEQSGYVRRVADPVDRRRVVVEVIPDKMADILPLLERVGRASTAEIGRYTDAQLQLIGDFLSRMADVTRAEAAKVRDTDGDTPATALHGSSAAPIGGLSTARLQFRSGASEVRLSGDRGLTELYRATFEGAVPQVRLRAGVVTIQYRGGLLDWRRRKADIALTTGVSWDVSIKGGASKMDADLRELDLRSFDLTGGTSQLELHLGRPKGVVPLRLVGGSSALSIDRPRGVPVRLSVVGGVSRLEFDGQSVGSRGGMTMVESTEAGKAADRYAVEILGGASRVEISERDA